MVSELPQGPQGPGDQGKGGLLHPRGCRLPQDGVGVGTERSGLSRRSGCGMGLRVWERWLERMTEADSLLAGRETTDWPGQRRQRSRVPHSRGREADGRRVRALSGQLSSSSVQRVCAQPRGRGGGAFGCGMSQTQPPKEKFLSISALWAPGAASAGIGTVAPLRHLVGASQVGRALALFPREPQALRVPRGWPSAMLRERRHSAVSSDSNRG